MAVAIACAGLFAVSLVTGILFEQSQRARDRERYPQVGHFVDIGGRTLNIDCAGTGQPVVVLESGANWALSSEVRDPPTIFKNGGPRPGYSWVAIQRALAPLSTVCWYDRAGSGWSDLGPYPRDSASQARDLHALLEAASLPPPYVLVGESSAALDVRVYSGFYPSDVAGLALVNWADPALFLDPQSTRGSKARMMPQAVYHSQDAMAQLFNFIGFYRLGPIPQEPPPPKEFTAADWDTIWHLTHRSKAISALMQDIASWRLSSAQARDAGNLGDRPLLVLSAGSISAKPEFLDAWSNAQIDLARLSTRSKQITVFGGAGDLLYDAPDDVARALRGFLAQIQESAPQR